MNNGRGVVMDAKKLYFTSDLHFYHKNIIKYVNRPFKSMKDMHDKLIKNWNSVIKDGDDVFILGDFIFTSNIKKTKMILDSLNGNKHLILGNHDEINRLERDSIVELFTTVEKTLFIKVLDEETKEHQSMFLCHYPMLSWRASAKGSWNLHGHIHSGPKSTAKDKNMNMYPTQYDVGVDNNNFTPISYNEVKIIITKQYMK